MMNSNNTKAFNFNEKNDKSAKMRSFLNSFFYKLKIVYQSKK